MSAVQEIPARIKDVVESVRPDATVILYGSRSRGDYHEMSDWDVLILVDGDKLTGAEKRKITYPLFDIEIETGELISPLVLTRSDWETRHRITPFYENVLKEGQTL
ncbi:nucleotidyltransferase domain-containing protein [Pricia sp.]|uniref:nucleotidyltransferase domain-containing protein n=1 Tax=Pricia sp. TaxID=2268138 RepID=UPI0035940D92